METRKDDTGYSLTDKQRFWLEHIQTAEREGLSPRLYAQRHGLHTAQFYYWRSTLRKRGVLARKDEPLELVSVRIRDTRAEVRVHLPNGGWWHVASRSLKLPGCWCGAVQVSCHDAPER